MTTVALFNNNIQQHDPLISGHVRHTDDDNKLNIKTRVIGRASWKIGARRRQ